jgi:glucosamine-6-phosphate deaminase
MDIIILEDSDQVAAQGAAKLQKLLLDKPAAVLGLATGGTPIALYRRLVAGHLDGKLTFRDASSFNLDEYIGVRPTDPQSYRSYMQRHLFEQIDIDVANTFLPACAADENPLKVGPKYEQLIAARGGIDLQVLGIGQNGHIGFNEPSSSLRSRTRIKTLTRATIADNRQYFDTTQVQPQLAITMGIATIMEAGEIVLLATGSNKATAIRQSIEGPVSAMWPASILQMHERVTVLLDSDAAAELVNRDYYDWVQKQKQLLLRGIEGD